MSRGRRKDRGWNRDGFERGRDRVSDFERGHTVTRGQYYARPGSSTFRAKFAGVCARCGEQFPAGTPITNYGMAPDGTRRWGHRSCRTRKDA